MNNQVEGLQEQIAKLRSDITLAKGRGDERERQQRLQVREINFKISNLLCELLHIVPEGNLGR